MEQLSPLSTVSTIQSAGIRPLKKFERQSFDHKPRLKSTLNLLTARSESNQEPAQLYTIFIDMEEEREKIKRSETQGKLQKLDVTQANESTDFENKEKNECRQIFIPDYFTVGEALNQILEIENIKMNANDFSLVVAKKNGKPKTDIPPLDNTQKLSLTHFKRLCLTKRNDNQIEDNFTETDRLALRGYSNSLCKSLFKKEIPEEAPKKSGLLLNFFSCCRREAFI